MSHIENFDPNVKTVGDGTLKFLKLLLPNISWVEIKKIIPVFGLFFLIAFVYHVLRCLKITLLVKADGSGAQVIPFIKFWLVMPSAIIFTYFYARLARHQNRTILIYNVLGIFAGFFILFALFLYPNKEQLSINLLSNLLANKLDNKFYAIMPILTHWPEALFYIMAEMWSIIVLSILFWGFCNEVTKIEDAKRFYALIALGANCAGIVAGQFMQLISKFVANSWEQSIMIFMVTTIISCFLIIIIFIKLNNEHNFQCSNNSSSSTLDADPLVNKKHKHKISLLESIKYIFRYKYVALLAIIVITYNIVFNLADVIWIDQLNQRFSSATDLNNYLAQLDFLIGIFSLIIGIFIFTNMMNKFGWTITAMVPPIVWLITSCGLYITIYAEKHGFSSINNLILILGTLQISLGKALKYCIFDQIKEMSFIPLSIEQQRNTKAIIDGIISRSAKSSSSLILQGLLIFGFSEISGAIPIVAIIIMITIVIWSWATCKMGVCINNNNLIN